MLFRYSNNSNDERTNKMQSYFMPKCHEYIALHTVVLCSILRIYNDMQTVQNIT